jgi:hypothetical protein
MYLRDLPAKDSAGKTLFEKNSACAEPKKAGEQHRVTIAIRTEVTQKFWA